MKKIEIRKIEINKLDEKKKKVFANRTLISIFVLFYYLLVVILSLLSDASNNRWIHFSEGSDVVVTNTIAIIFLLLVYLPTILSIVEINNLIFKKNNDVSSKKNKISLIFLLIAGSILFLGPNIVFIVSRYFVDDLPTLNETIDDTANSPIFIETINPVNNVDIQKTLYLFFGSVFGAMFITVIIVNVTLGVLKENNFKNVITLNFLMFIVPFGFMSIVLVGLLKSWVVLLYLLIIVMSTDVSCYICGLFFGKHKMAPIVSPNKTWEGAILGSITSTILVIAYVALFKLDHSHNAFNNLVLFETETEYVKWLWIIFVSIALVIISISGDLMFSYIKRKFEIKDYSNILRSHGGILDRVDSLIFTVSAYTIILFIVSSIGTSPLLSDFR